MRQEITYLPISRLHPHPDNPRKDLGDLTELADSIRENGIFQNLTVVDDDPSEYMSDYTVIIGHRRLAAAKLAGLTEVPCAVVEMTPAEQVQTMLLENMQRSDLTVYEQAQGFQMMLDFGYSVAEISEKTGLSHGERGTGRKMLAERYTLILRHEMVDMETGDKVQYEPPICVNYSILNPNDRTGIVYGVNQMLDKLGQEILKRMDAE